MISSYLNFLDIDTTLAKGNLKPDVDHHLGDFDFTLTFVVIDACYIVNGTLVS